MHRALWLPVLGLLAALSLLGGCAAQESSNDTAPRSVREPAARGDLSGEAATVTEVIDGDTIHVRRGRGPYDRVRLIGIDAPERSTTRTGYAECGGEQATQALRTLLPSGTGVHLTFDAVQDHEDRFGRLLAYVQRDTDAVTAQELMLRSGWARVYVYDRRPFTRVSAFRRAASAGRSAGRGVFRACGGDFTRPAS